MKKLVPLLLIAIIVAISCKKALAPAENKLYTLIASASANGAISQPGTNTVGSGLSWTYFITPDPGYAIAVLMIDGSPVTITDSYTFTHVTANHTISVTFSKLYTISVIAGPHGITDPLTLQVKAGENAKFVLKPKPYFHVDSVWLDGVFTPTNGDNHYTSSNFYTITNIKANHVLKVSFTDDTLPKKQLDSLNKLLVGKWIMTSLNSTLVGGSGNFLGWDVQDIYSYCSSNVYSQYYANGVYVPNANLDATSCSPLGGQGHFFQQFQISRPNHWKWKNTGTTLYMTDPPLDSLTNITLTKDSLIAIYYGGFNNVPRVAYWYHYARKR